VHACTKCKHFFKKIYLSFLKISVIYPTIKKSHLSR